MRDCPACHGACTREELLSRDEFGTWDTREVQCDVCGGEGGVSARETPRAPRGQRAYLEGRFDMCKLLATSPRFNKPQMEIIKEQAYKEQERLEALGVKFTKPVPHE